MKEKTEADIIVEQLRSYIPKGDGYNSDFAKTMWRAIHFIEQKQELLTPNDQTIAKHKKLEEDNGEPAVSNLFKKAIIDDVSSHSINEALKSNLLDLFEYAMKSVATTLVHEARFETSDFATAKERECESFTLLVRRACTDSRNEWFGAFQRGEQRLDVIGHLE